MGIVLTPDKTSDPIQYPQNIQSWNPAMSHNDEKKFPNLNFHTALKLRRRDDNSAACTSVIFYGMKEIVSDKIFIR